MTASPSPRRSSRRGTDATGRGRAARPPPPPPPRGPPRAAARRPPPHAGPPIAWAVVEAVHDRNRCRCLFATHYHELTRLAEGLGGLAVHHGRAGGWAGALAVV